VRLLIFIILFFLSACDSKQGMSLDLKHLIETSYKKPGSDCRQIANVTGFTLNNAGFARSYQASLESILKETHATGGNFLFITRASLDGTNLDGVSYSCSAKKEE